MKASSSGWLKKEFPGCSSFAWQYGYGSFGVCASLLERTREYIKNQEEHHKKQSYEEEYIKILDLNNVKYDPKYIFD